MVNKKKNVKPFLKWAGGKTSLLNKILPHVPENNGDSCYWEPFLGSGSMFFSMCPQRAVLSDLNHHLIYSFMAIRDKPHLVHNYLHSHYKNHSESYYYKIRDTFNSSNNSIAQCARFIYLNKACFNGLYRENKKGQFNVPYGKRKKPSF